MVRKLRYVSAVAWRKFRQVFRIDNEDGVTAIEYGLLAGVIAIGIVVAAGLVGTEIGNIFDAVATALTPVP